MELAYYRAKKGILDFQRFLAEVKQLRQISKIDDGDLDVLRRAYDEGVKGKYGIKKVNATFDTSKMTISKLKRIPIIDIVNGKAKFACGQKVVDPKLVLRYAKKMKVGVKFHPIKIYPPAEGSKWVIGEGHHRYLAALIANKPINVIKMKGAKIPFYWHKMEWH